MDFVTGLPPILTHCKGHSYDSILVIVNRLKKIVHYETVKVTTDAPGLAEVILDVVVRHHGLPDLIVTDGGSFFTSKFWSSSFYFLNIKRRLSTALPPPDQRSKVYLRAFVKLQAERLHKTPTHGPVWLQQRQEYSLDPRSVLAYA